MDMAPLELGMNEKSEPKLWPCNNKERILHRDYKLLEVCCRASNITSASLMFQILQPFLRDRLLLAHVVMPINSSSPFFPVLSLTVAKMGPLTASFTLYGHVWLITSLRIES